MRLTQITTYFWLISASLFILGCSQADQHGKEAEKPAQISLEIVDHKLGTAEPKPATSGVFSGAYVDAVVFRNNDDDDGNGIPDDEDNIVNGAMDSFDMTQVIMKGLQSVDSASLSFSDDAEGSFRVFLGPDMLNLDLTKPFDLAAVTHEQESLSLWLEATQFAGPEFDGTIELTFATESASGTHVKTLVFKVAPWLMLSNASLAQELLIREHVGRNDIMIEQLKAILPSANVTLNVIPASAPYDDYNIWLQDTIEIGRQFKPDDSMPVVLQANRNKSIDAFSKAELLGRDFGWMRVGEYRPEFARGSSDDGKQPKTPEWIDWFGNLEVSPPLPNHPHGRVYFGENAPGEQLDPKIVAMIDAQQLQGPAFKLDVSFLMIKHADEVLSFVPSGIPDMPWYALVPSTKMFIEMATAWQSQGHGDLPIFDRFEENYTLNQFLADEALVAHNLAIQNTLDKNKATLMRELGLPAAAIIEIPVAFKRNGTSLTPNMVNSAKVNNYFLVPDPNGPMVEGKDLLQEAFVELLEPSTVNIEFIDDRQYHMWWGNVHCATNVIRSGDEQFEAMN